MTVPLASYRLCDDLGDHTVASAAPTELRESFCPDTHRLRRFIPTASAVRIAGPGHASSIFSRRLSRFSGTITTCAGIKAWKNSATSAFIVADRKAIYLVIQEYAATSLRPLMEFLVGTATYIASQRWAFRTLQEEDSSAFVALHLNPTFSGQTPIYCTEIDTTKEYVLKALQNSHQRSIRTV